MTSCISTSIAAGKWDRYRWPVCKQYTSSSHNCCKTFSKTPCMRLISCFLLEQLCLQHSSCLTILAVLKKSKPHKLVRSITNLNVGVCELGSLIWLVDPWGKVEVTSGFCMIWNATDVSLSANSSSQSVKVFPFGLAGHRVSGTVSCRKSN